VRIGRRLLIPADAVARLDQRQTPQDVKSGSYTTMGIVRTPAPRYDYFAESFTDTELDRVAETLIATVKTGGFPEGTFQIKTDGIRRIILGQETAPPFFWRYLCDGIERRQRGNG